VDCRLQIMTMHKAKGLQFDHVVLHGLGRTAKSTDKAVLSWSNDPDGSGSGDMLISPVGPQSEVENDPLHQYIESIQKEKERFELDRILYVSCTRARKSLHLIGNVGLAPDGQSYRSPIAASLLYRLWPALEGEFARAFRASGIAEQAATFDNGQAQFVRPMLRRLSARPSFQPPQLPAVPGAESRPRAAPEATVSYEWVGATARYAGTIVHRWLQRIADGKADLGGMDRSAIRDWTRAAASRSGVSTEDLEPVCNRVMHALDGISSDAKGRWLLSGAGQAEYPITGIVDGRVQSVIIDRVRIDEAGVHWIVDYKTGTHEGGDLAGFLSQETERHRPQLEKYAAIYRNLTDAPVRAALYFPLLQKFCEIPLRD
jgi:ATP-dependent exoDNAse (exonuclease V) beta subunit